MSAEEVTERRSQGLDMSASISASPALDQSLAQIASGRFSPEEPDRYRELIDSLRHHDHFLVAADFEAFAAKQVEVSERWRNKSDWWRSSILNIAQMGWFSSDRAVREYAEEIWKVPLSA
jgi:starch phosphorylase